MSRELPFVLPRLVHARPQRGNIAIPPVFRIHEGRLVALVAAALICEDKRLSELEVSKRKGGYSRM